MKNDSLLEKYKTLIILSLEAQARDDVVQEERIIDDLDVVWAKMSNEKRLLAGDINQEAIAWFNAERRSRRQLDRACDTQSIESSTRTSKVEEHSISVIGNLGMHSKRSDVHWSYLSLISVISSSADSSCAVAVAA